MSDIAIQLAGRDFALEPVAVKRDKRVDNPDKPGKKKTITTEVSLVMPRITNRGDVVALFGALFDHAESQVAGNGVKLFHALLEERAEWGEAAQGDRADSTTPYRDAFVSIEAPRSAGLSEKDILTQMALLGAEAAQIGAGLSSAEAWTTIVDPNTGARLFDSQDALIQRWAHLKTTIDNLTAQLAQRQLRQEESRRKREEKAKAAAAAAAAAAAPAPAGN